ISCPANSPGIEGVPAATGRESPPCARRQENRIAAYLFVPPTSNRRVLQRYGDGTMRIPHLLFVAVCLSVLALSQQTIREVQNAGPGAPAQNDKKKELSAEDRKAAAALLKTSEA